MKPIPAQMLQHTVKVIVPRAVDTHQQAKSLDIYYVTRCCLQRASSTARAKDNSQLTSTATLFVDARLSIPRLDWLSLKAQADAAGGVIKIMRNE